MCLSSENLSGTAQWARRGFKPTVRTVSQRDTVWAKWPRCTFLGRHSDRIVHCHICPSLLMRTSLCPAEAATIGTNGPNLPSTRILPTKPECGKDQTGVKPPTPRLQTNIPSVKDAIFAVVAEYLSVNRLSSDFLHLQYSILR